MLFRVLTGIALFALACSRPEVNGPFVFPETPVGVVPQPETNPATVAGVELGRRLFFDPLLSSNGQISCATCHLPQLAFSDGVALSTRGVSGKPLIRHAPALFNLAWFTGFFWDGGSRNLESQVFGPLMHVDEMAMDLNALIEKLSQHPEYPALFKKAWGSDTITTQTLVRAIAQYERTLLSFGSRYDAWKAGKANLTRQEMKGLSIYKTLCESCHPAPLFTDLGYHNNAIDTAFTDRREELILFGRYRITNDSADIGKFKTPSLRNMGFTAPFMHDGRFANLDAVFDHYFREHGGNALADPVLKTGSYAAVQAEEREALKAFLMTLNDSAFAKP